MSTLLKTIALPVALLLHLAIKFLVTSEFTTEQNFNAMSFVVEESKTLPSIALDEVTEKIQSQKVKILTVNESSDEEIVDKEIDTKSLESVYVVLN